MALPLLHFRPKHVYLRVSARPLVWRWAASHPTPSTESSGNENGKTAHVLEPSWETDHSQCDIKQCLWGTVLIGSLLQGPSLSARTVNSSRLLGSQGFSSGFLLPDPMLSCLELLLAVYLINSLKAKSTAVSDHSLRGTGE